MNLYQQVEAALLQPVSELKCDQVRQLQADWDMGLLGRAAIAPLLAIDDPGRPEQPLLVDPRKLKQRSSATEQGRICLLHAVAHIEFNAINIALDAVYRFRDMPAEYVRDWLAVAADEARHFALLNEALLSRGSFYSAIQAHSGLWDMVCKTRDDVLHRMALVPRVMEARGLDVTPAMIDKFNQAEDSNAAEILAVILQDEIGHVRIGNHWYDYLCQQRGLDAKQTFQDLVACYLGGRLRGPFNHAARLEAGFERSELELIEQLGQA